MKVAGIPLIALMGGITVVECAAGIYAIVSPAVASGFLSLGPLLYSALIPLGVGWVIYGAAFAYNSAKHTPIAMRFKEIPPE